MPPSPDSRSVSAPVASPNPLGSSTASTPPERCSLAPPNAVSRPFGASRNDSRFEPGSVDLALLVTTICFVDDVDQTLASARRILQSDGLLVVGLIDADSPLGHRYRKHQDESPFYRHATLHSTEEIRDRLEAAGFSELEYRQTLFDDPAALDRPDRIREGFGDGGFVGIAARP